MSLDGISQTFIPYNINGLTEVNSDTSVVTTLQLNSLTPNKAVVSDSNNFLISSGTSNIEIDYLIGTTSSVQTQINTKASTSYVDTQNSSQDIVINTKASTSYVDTQLGLKSDLSYVNTQLNLKSNLSGGNIFTGTQTIDTRLLGTLDGSNFWIGLKGNGTEVQRLAIAIAGDTITGVVNTVNIAKALNLPSLSPNRVMTLNADSIVVASATSSTELGYVSGVTSSIQTQLNTKADTSYVNSQNSAQDSVIATKASTTYVDSADGLRVLKAGDTMTGKLTCVGVDTTAQINIGLVSNIVPFLKTANSSNHYNSTATEAYLFQGQSGSIMIGNSTLRDATTCNLMIGSPLTNVSEIVSIKSDGSGFLPLNFAGSSYSFTSGNVGIGSANPLCSLYNYASGTTGWKAQSYFGNENTGVIAGCLDNKAVLGGHNGALNAWTDIYIAPAGNVSIGDGTPSEKLTVNGNALVYGSLRTYGNGGGAGAISAENVGSGNAYAVMFLKNNSASGCYWFLNSTTRSTDGGSNTATLRNDAGTLRLMSKGNGILINGTTGNIGIGIDDPTSMLHVQGNIDGVSFTNSNYYNFNGSFGGLLWQSTTRELSSAEQCANIFGTVSVRGTGRNGYRGYGLDSRYCFMKNDSSAEWGIHDNTHSWMITGSGGSNRDVTIGGGVAKFDRSGDRCQMYANAANTTGGYFYYNNSNNFGTISDRRIKKDFQSVPINQSILFIKALEPTSFCLKESECKATLADGTETDETSSVCSCRQDGWVAQNILNACEISGASKSVINRWGDYENELKLPEEERKTLIGVSDRPILSHTVNVVKELLTQIETLQKRNELLEEHARELEYIAKRIEDTLKDYKQQTDLKIEKLASLITQLLKK